MNSNALAQMKLALMEGLAEDKKAYYGEIFDKIMSNSFYSKLINSISPKQVQDHHLLLPISRRIVESDDLDISADVLIRRIRNHIKSIPWDSIGNTRGLLVDIEAELLAAYSETFIILEKHRNIELDAFPKLGDVAYPVKIYTKLTYGLHLSLRDQIIDKISWCQDNLAKSTFGIDEIGYEDPNFIEKYQFTNIDDAVRFKLIYG
jgi:hypothetical protein